jgi:hypothetical protein
MEARHSAEPNVNVRPLLLSLDGVDRSSLCAKALVDGQDIPTTTTKSISLWLPELRFQHFEFALYPKPPSSPVEILRKGMLTGRNQPPLQLSCRFTMEPRSLGEKPGS